MKPKMHINPCKNKTDRQIILGLCVLQAIIINKLNDYSLKKLSKYNQIIFIYMAF